jgi:hypothetical protein
MSFTAELTHSMRVVDPEAFGATGRTTAYEVDTLRLTGGTRRMAFLDMGETRLIGYRRKSHMATAARMPERSVPKGYPAVRGI